MRILSIFIFLFLFSCQKNSEHLENIAIAQWDYRTKSDSLGNPIQTFYFPKCFLIKNNKFYVYRYLNATSRFDYQDKQYEYGECLGSIPEKILSRIKMINPLYFDTIYPYAGILYEDLHYSLVDLKTKRYSLFIPYNISDTTFEIISQLMKYTDTTQIKKSNDTVGLFFIRESVKQMVKRHSVQEIIRFTPPVVN
jgi:hypothetical protein